MVAHLLHDQEGEKLRKGIHLDNRGGHRKGNIASPAVRQIAKRTTIGIAELGREGIQTESSLFQTVTQISRQEMTAPLMSLLCFRISRIMGLSTPVQQLAFTLMMPCRRH